jgi:hypothetical protein
MIGQRENKNKRGKLTTYRFIFIRLLLDVISGLNIMENTIRKLLFLTKFI